MKDPEVTPEQRKAIKRVDKILSAHGLPTYETLEERLAMALTACWESVELGKQLKEMIEKQSSV